MKTRAPKRLRRHLKDRDIRAWINAGSNARERIERREIAVAGGYKSR
jgi:hypothetical protein